MLCPADLTLSTHFLRFVQSSECEWIAVLRVTRGTHQFSLDFLSKWLEIVWPVLSRPVGSNPTPSASEKPSHIKAFAHMTGFFFSLKVTSAYMIFGKSLSAASRSAPAASPAPPAGNRPQCTAASWALPLVGGAKGSRSILTAYFSALWIIFSLAILIWAN